MPVLVERTRAGALAISHPNLTSFLTLLLPYCFQQTNQASIIKLMFQTKKLNFAPNHIANKWQNQVSNTDLILKFLLIKNYSGRASQSTSSEARRRMDRKLGRDKDSVSKELARESRKLGDRLEPRFERKAGEHCTPGTCEKGLKGCMCYIPSGMSERASPTAHLAA